MTLAEIGSMPELQTVYVPDADCVVSGGYTSDLLSDVMANAPQDAVLITIQAHKNTVAVSVLAGIKAIIVCNYRSVPEDMVQAAKKEGLAIFRTRENQFTISGKLYEYLYSNDQS